MSEVYGGDTTCPDCGATIGILNQPCPNCEAKAAVAMLRGQRMKYFTTVIGIDEEHYDEWLIARESFERVAPEVLSKVLFLVDEGFTPGRQGQERWDELAKGVGDFQVEIVPQDDSMTQRERMLTALTVMPHKYVDTPWFLKLDTDAVAVSPLVIPEQVRENKVVLAAPKWGYTKPPSAMKALEEWAMIQPEFLGQRKRLPEYRVEGGKAKHPRIISYFCWVNTEWSREINERYLITGRLPVPSQDTFLWFITRMREDVALRLGSDAKAWCIHKTGLDRINEAVKSTRPL